MSTQGRIDIAPYTISSLDQTVYTQYEYTHQDVVSVYLSNISVIFDIYNRAATTDPISPDRITQEDADNVSQALSNLTDLAQNGLVRAYGDAPPQTYFLTQQMAANLDLIIRSFKATGAISPTESLSDAQLEKWKDLSVTNPVIQNVLSSALQAQSAAHSIQALIEMEYVVTGNQLIQNKMQNLADALDLTKGILATLSNIQEARNGGVTMTTPPGIDFKYGGTVISVIAAHQTHVTTVQFITKTHGTIRTTTHQTYYMTRALTTWRLVKSVGEYANLYSARASAYYGHPLVPQIPDSLVTTGFFGVPLWGQITAAGSAYLDKILSYRQSLLLQLPTLSASTSAADRADSNSLYNRVKSVLNGMSVYLHQALITPANAPDIAFRRGVALASWLSDGYANPLIGTTAGGQVFLPPAGSSSGADQRALTNAITAAESLNDQQKQQVNQFLFVFEEFYKSASSILQRLSQIIERMGQATGR